MREGPPDDVLLVSAALGTLPSSLAEALARDPGFCQSIGLPLRSRWHLDALNLELDLTDALEAVRTWYRVGAATLTSQDGSPLPLKGFGPPDQQGVAVVIGERLQPLPSVAVLSPVSDVRSRCIEISAETVLLDPAIKASWAEAVRARPLHDREYEALEEDFDLTPTRMLSRLRDSISKGSSSAEMLAPGDRRYYERLVGPPPEHPELFAYCQAVARRGREMVASYGVRGLSQALHLCGHPAISHGLAEALPTIPELVLVGDDVGRTGGFLRLVAMIELVLPRLGESPELNPTAEALVERIIELDDARDPTRYGVLSALFRLVDGCFAASGIADGTPPLWRRHACLVQASLLEEEIVRSAVDQHDFIDWAAREYGGYFHQQTLADIRIEPRWLPWMAGAGQLRAELIGRVTAAAMAARDGLPPPLRRRLLGRAKTSLLKRTPIPQAFLPGPLEGGFFAAPPPPEWVRHSVWSALSTSEITAASFGALVNAASMFGVGADYAELAGEALRQAQHRLRGSPRRADIVAVLEGLASVAAVARSHSLADELRILVRRHRVSSAVCLTPSEAFHIGFIAAASREDVSGWAEFAADWALELALQDLSKEEAEHLHANLTWLASRVPELALHGGRSIAALEALLAK